MSVNAPETFVVRRPLFRKALSFASLVMVAQLVWVPRVGCAGSLSMLIEGVLASHPSIRVQQELGQSSQEAVKSARWQFYPTPSVALEQVLAAPGDPSYGGGGNRVTVLRLQQPLWSGGRLTAGLEKAEAGVLYGQASVEVARQDLALRVVQAYSDWYGAYLKGAAFGRNLEAYARLRQQIARRIAQGISPESDLTLLVGRVGQTDAELAVAKAQQVTALARLGQLLGKPVEAAELAKSSSRPLDLDGTSQDVLERAQAGSPNVARLVAQVRISEAEIAARKGGLSPEVYVRAERQYGNFSSINAKPENRIFFGLSTQLGAGLSLFSQVNEAQARYRAALADVEGARSSLGEQVLADYAQAESGGRRLVSLAASLRASESISEAWARQFLAGRKSWLDVMNAARELAQIEAQIADVDASQLMLTWRLFILTRGVDASISLNQL